MPPKQAHSEGRYTYVPGNRPNYDAYRDALCRVFPGAKDRSPPPWARQDDQPLPPKPYWRPGSIPPDRMPIDDEVRELADARDNQRKGAKLLTTEALRDRRVYDAYAVAREFAALAHIYGLDAERRQPSIPRTRDLRKEIANDKEALQHLEKAEALLSAKRRAEPPYKQGAARADLCDHRDHRDAEAVAAQRINELPDVISTIRTRIERTEKRAEVAPTRPDIGIYLRTFVEMMGNAWFLLTNLRPSTAEKGFVTFVTQGIACFDEKKEVSPAHAIRTMMEELDARPIWDRHDRAATGSTPPNLHVLHSALTNRPIYSDEKSVVALYGDNLPIWHGEWLANVVEPRLAFARCAASLIESVNEAERQSAAFDLRFIRQAGSPAEMDIIARKCGASPDR